MARLGPVLARCSPSLDNHFWRRVCCSRSAVIGPAFHPRAVQSPHLRGVIVIRVMELAASIVRPPRCSRCGGRPRRTCCSSEAKAASTGWQQGMSCVSRRCALILEFGGMCASELRYIQGPALDHVVMRWTRGVGQGSPKSEKGVAQQIRHDSELEVVRKKPGRPVTRKTNSVASNIGYV